MDFERLGLRPFRIGGGTVESEAGGVLRLGLPAAGPGYADAQLDDTAGRPRAEFQHRPPFRMRLRARASTPRPVGTLGFGLWNDPFAFSLGFAGASRKLPAWPQALWFFYGSPPNDLAYAEPGVPDGWKAASLRSPRGPGLTVAAGAVGLMALRPFRKIQGWAVRKALSFIRAAEVRIDVQLAEWHAYELTWTQAGAEFRVDGATVLRVAQPPDPPLGFVAWIDNQYAILSPGAGVRFGVLPVIEPQFLELAELVLEESSAV